MSAPLKHKYVRHSKLGFVLWPDGGDLWHVHVGDLLLRRVPGKIVSAGFAEFCDGDVICYGESESLKIRSGRDDTDALMHQLGLEVSGAPAGAERETACKP